MLHTNYPADLTYETAVGYGLTYRLRSMREDGMSHFEIAMVQTIEELAVIAEHFVIDVERIFAGRSTLIDTAVVRCAGEFAQATLYATDRRSALLIIVDERDPELSAFLDAAQSLPEAYWAN